MPPRDRGLLARLGRLLHVGPRIRTTGAARTRGPITHVIIMDGTMSSLRAGSETNAGLTYKLCSEAAAGANQLVHYEAGIQWNTWRDARSVIEGRGINRQIYRVYGALASRYRPGDRIYLFGFSRGAYAVRSLAGFIDKIGLVRADQATVRNIRTGYRHYQFDPKSDAARTFAAKTCHEHVPIEFLGVWDTVSALGIRWPILWRFSSVFHEFHDNRASKCVKRAYHALAYHERRAAYQPVLFDSNPDAEGQILQQMWFRGSHGDIGGQLGRNAKSRKLANTTLVWMLDKAEAAGLALPEGWRGRYLADPHGPSIGMNKGWGKLFILRKSRPTGRDPSEVLHPAIHAD
ncbi:DUF2235 domain-containing protein [Celeribacter arenosi]|uniref:DUF2235 domain-containing protein n=1 Tax=Celeribacter arenosi TaxID=792649 RepID=A0ABP7K915_9RHOB